MSLQVFRHWIPTVKDAFDRTLMVAKFFCSLHVTNTFLCTCALAMGPSMLPTLNLTGSLVLVERLSIRFGKMASGDVVLIRSPEEPRKVVIKRIVGVEGDAVGNEEATAVVPKGHIWIEGDNKHNSRDSRQFGPVPYGLLEGRVFWVMWPPEDFGSVGRKVENISLERSKEGFSVHAPLKNQWFIFTQIQMQLFLCAWDQMLP
nr:mitochondrial inner membrane protease subunit 1-like isoform X2 [Coffea arabica]